MVIIYVYNGYKQQFTVYYIKKEILFSFPVVTLHCNSYGSNLFVKNNMETLINIKKIYSEINFPNCFKQWGNHVQGLK